MKEALTPRPPPLRGANISSADVPTVGEGETIGESRERRHHQGVTCWLPSPVRGERARGEGLLASVRFGWQVCFGAVRDFVWADLREGVLDLRGLGSPLRALVWLGFGLLLLVILAILQGDLWRQSFPLVALTQGIPGRGRLIPSAVIPVSFFLLSLAWSFVLAGALRSRRLIRFGVLGLWALTMTGSMVSGGTAGLSGFAIGAADAAGRPDRLRRSSPSRGRGGCWRC